MGPRTLLLVLSVLCLAGCATRPVSLKASRELRADHILRQPGGVATSLERGGKIIVTRDSGMGGSASLLKIFVDGAPVAKLNRYERYEVMLKEGDHLLGVVPTLNPLGMTIREVSVSLKPGETYYFRVGFDNSGAFIQPSAFTR